MNVGDITPVLLTFDEAPNIGRSLERLKWASRVVVLDSFSTDATAEIARSFTNVDFQQRHFDSHTNQWNHALSLARTDWVLSLDADYLVPEILDQEIGSRRDADSVAAYFARFEYQIFGRPLRGTLYPPRAVLFRRSACSYQQDGHTQILRVSGRTAMLGLGDCTRRPQASAPLASGARPLRRARSREVDERAARAAANAGSASTVDNPGTARCVLLHAGLEGTATRWLAGVVLRMSTDGG